MLLEKIKQDIMIARKSKDSILSTFLSTLFSEASMVGKNDGNRESTDEEVLQTIRKFLKNNKEMIDFCNKNGKNSDKFITEETILKNYLPQQLSEEALTKEIVSIISELPEKSPKMMGNVMSTLKTKFDGLYDGKMASKIVKENL